MRVKQMLAEGHCIKKISRDTEVTRNTIRKWKHFEILPPKRSPKMTNIHIYDEMVRKILNENPSGNKRDFEANYRNGI